MVVCSLLKGSLCASTSLQVLVTRLTCAHGVSQSAAGSRVIQLFCATLCEKHGRRLTDTNVHPPSCAALIAGLC